MNKDPFESLFEPIESKKISPFIRFVAVISALALFFLSIQGYFYLVHPEPRVKLTLADVQDFLPSLSLELKVQLTFHLLMEAREQTLSLMEGAVLSLLALRQAIRFKLNPGQAVIIITVSG